MILDIAIGILLGSYFGGESFNYGLIILGVLFCLLPDIDIFSFAYQKYIKKTNIINHRSWTHYPVAYLPLYLIILFIEMGLNLSHTISLMFALSILWHFLHDTLFIGWGVMWGWPFSKRKYKIFTEKDGKITTRFLLSWLPEEEEKIIKWSGGSVDGWIRHYYFKLNIITILEYGVFIFTALHLYFKYFVV